MKTNTTGRPRAAIAPQAANLRTESSLIARLRSASNAIAKNKPTAAPQITNASVFLAIMGRAGGYSGGALASVIRSYGGVREYWIMPTTMPSGIQRTAHI